MPTKRIQTSELDFDAIKNNLKEFLQGQDQFLDYDFEGSAINVLLDVLAYNTHYNALYTNLAVNESFLDSASKRSSIVSRAKEIGYVPRSSLAATATIDLTISNTTSTPGTLTLPKYSPFTTTIDGTSYTFYTLDDTTATLANGQYVFKSIEIKEGTPLIYKYNVSSGQRYLVPNVKVDISTLKVKLQENDQSSEFTNFSAEGDIVYLTDNSPVYFLKEIDGELYELTFGNGVVGRALEDGNIIHLEYLVTNEDAANGARLFSYQGSSLLGGTSAVQTITKAVGGQAPEDIESIRYNAPRAYSAQNRGVTVEDYRNLILSNYSNAESVNVWGGEDNDPPIYGKVFLCIKPKEGLQLTTAEKNAINRDVLRTRNVVSVIPEIVDPKYINLTVTSSVYYNPRLTDRSPADLRSLVIDTIKEYNDVNLQKFDSVFRISRLASEIDQTESSIVSNITRITLDVRLIPKYDSNAEYRIVISNPIVETGEPQQAVSTTGFFIPGSSRLHYIDDDGAGKLRLYNFIGINKNIVNPNIGSVNYSLGKVVVDSLFITGLDPEEKYQELTFKIRPQSYDAISVRDQLVTIPDDQIEVNMVADQVSAGDAGGGINYTFSSSRS